MCVLLVCLAALLCQLQGPSIPQCSPALQTASLILDTVLRLYPVANARVSDASAVQAALAALPGSNPELYGMCVPALSDLPPISVVLNIELLMPDPAALYRGVTAAAPPTPRAAGGSVGGGGEGASARDAAPVAMDARVLHALITDIRHAIALALRIHLEQVPTNGLACLCIVPSISCWAPKA